MLKIFNFIYKGFRCIREFFISIFFILFVLLCYEVFSLVGTESSGKNPATFPEKGALTLDLDGYLADNHDEFGELHRLLQSEMGRAEPYKISTFDVALAISKAAKDDQITGLVLDLGYFQGGDYSSLAFIGQEIQQFKKSGKPVIAIGEQYDQKQYFLASFADKIYLNKAGFVELTGLSYSNLYFKSLLDKLEAQPHIFRVGTYKSAVEPFLRDDMSPEAKQNAQGWLNSVWQNVRAEIAQNRGIKAEDVVQDVEQHIQQYKALKGDDSQYALSQKWVTDVATNGEIKAMLIEQFGKDSEGDYNHFSYEDYAMTLPDRFDMHGENKIAIVNVEGEIILGESDERSAGSDTIVKLLRKAKEDSDVKGVILRVNSPGGSAMASELIRQEVEDLQQAGKPVVTSMGGMAASGGYWISASSDRIIASPTTITGSIGIFGLSMDFEKTAKKVGVSEDGLETEALASSSAFKPLSKEQSELIQISIENGYDRFIDLVSRGRHIAKADVDKIAQGQVWSGEQALKNGLVDELGDFNSAYVAVQKLVNEKRQMQSQPAIEQFKAQWLIETDDSLFGGVARNLKLKAQLNVAKWLDLPFTAQFKQASNLLQHFNDPRSSYLYCLSCGELK